MRHDREIVAHQHVGQARAPAAAGRAGSGSRPAPTRRARRSARRAAGSAAPGSAPARSRRAGAGRRRAGAGSGSGSRAEPDLVQRPLDAPVPSPRRRGRGWRAARQHPVHRVARMERAVGSWKTIWQTRANARCAMRPCVSPATRDPPGRGRDQARDRRAAPSILPEPDSPTRPNASPSATRNETSRTAWTARAGAPCAEDDVEPLDLEDRRRRPAGSRRRSSSHAGSRSSTASSRAAVDPRQRARAARACRDGARPPAPRPGSSRRCGRHT